MNASEWIYIIIVIILLVVIFIFLILAGEAIVTENISPTGTTGETGFVCVSSGEIFTNTPPTYTRKTPKSIPNQVIDNSIPNFDNVEHTVQKSNRLRSIKIPTSPNGWSSQTTYGNDNFFLAYPYFVNLTNQQLQFSTYGNDAVSTSGNNTNFVPGMNDIFYNVSPGITFTMNSNTDVLSCDIVDIDAMITTIIYSYDNNSSLTYYCMNGSPYMTADVNNLSVIVNLNTSFRLNKSTNYYYDFRFTNTEYDFIGFLIFLSAPINILIDNNSIYLSEFSYIFRIATYTDNVAKNLLIDNYSTYATETTIVSDVTKADDVWEIENRYEWYINSIHEEGNLLLLTLPAHNLTNSTYFSSEPYYHPVIGPYSYTYTSSNTWKFNYTIPIEQLNFPTFSSSNLRIIWNNEYENLTNVYPTTFSDFCKWLGSLSFLYLIGKAGNYNPVRVERLLARINLELTNILNGSFDVVYDTEWNGIFSRDGLDDCSGTTDDGNSFYNNHLSTYGYLLLAYSIVLDNNFFTQNNLTPALLFARNVINPSSNDKYFPIWRNKNWYIGYSINSGLAPNQNNGKLSGLMGENIFAYYASYLLGMTTNNDSLTIWSLTCLATEINAYKAYFTLPENIISEFVQQTITERGDSYYYYTVMSDAKFPVRNANIISTLIFPLNLLSKSYLNNSWINFIQYWMRLANTDDANVDAKAAIYAILAKVDNNVTKLEYLNQIRELSSSSILSYGNTWSSVAYWVISLIN